MFEDEDEDESDSLLQEVSFQEKDLSNPHSILLEFLKPLHQIHHETGRQAPIDHPMIIRNRDRQHQTRLNLFTSHHCFHLPPTQTQNRHLRLVDNRRKMSTANPTLI